MLLVTTSGMVCRSYTLPVKDRAGRAWEFVIKSWANGTEHRRVYVLEQVSEYIKYNRLREGDAIGICADESGIVTIEVLPGMHRLQYPSWSSNSSLIAYREQHKNSHSCTSASFLRSSPALHVGLQPCYNK